MESAHVSGLNSIHIGKPFEKSKQYILFSKFLLQRGAFILPFCRFNHSKNLNDNGIYRYLSMFLRCDTTERIEKMKYVANKFAQDELSDKQFKKMVSELANPKIIPFYVGIYFTLFWTSFIIFVTFLCSLMIWGWGLY